MVIARAAVIMGAMHTWVRISLSRETLGHPKATQLLLNTLAWVVAVEGRWTPVRKVEWLRGRRRGR